MKKIAAEKLKENHIIYMGHINYYVMEVETTRNGDILTRGVYHDPSPYDEPTMTQIFAPNDVVIVY